MGILIGCERLSYEWPRARVLDDVTLGVDAGDRIGIVGKNGGGKSTLLRLIGHELEPDSGAVTWRQGLSVGMLGQVDSLDKEQSVSHEIVGDQPHYTWASNPETRRIIAELLEDIAWDARIATLSGGQRRRVDLARLLIGSWDVVLLDEPTNHLDLRTITWLAHHLRGRWRPKSGALLVVTHDRWFLDEVCTGMWEVHDSVVDPFEGGYSAYIQQRLERQRQAEARNNRRNNLLRKELAWLSRGPQARGSKPRFRVEAARAMVADMPPLRDALELKRLAVSRLGKQVFELKQASVVYDGHIVLDRLDWRIGAGERLGILGENGAGKSTLLRLLEGRIEPTSGSVRVGASVRLGVVSQHLNVFANRKTWRVRELLKRYRSSYEIGGKTYTPERLLEHLGFESLELETPIGGLSGGQARRLALMCVLLDEPNVLLLDEPGNDLDTDMLAVMEDLLDSWPGTLLLVSHDRSFMERVTDDQYALVEGRFTHCPGGVDEYLRRVGERRAEEDGAHDAVATAASGHAAQQRAAGGVLEVPTSEDEGLPAAATWHLKKQLASLERKMETQTSRIRKLEASLESADPTDYAALEATQAKVVEAQARLGELEAEWLALGEQLES